MNTARIFPRLVEMSSVYERSLCGSAGVLGVAANSIKSCSACKRPKYFARRFVERDGKKNLSELG